MTRVPLRVDLRTEQIDGYPLAYTVRGDGAPVVLVHGSLCDCRYWHAQIQDLERRFRVYSVSLRHYWPERWDGASADFSVARHARDIVGFIEALGLAPVHLLGHSRGGAVALNAALHGADRMATLTLADPGGLLPHAGAPARGDYRAQSLKLIQDGDIDAALARFVDAVSGADTWRRMVPWFQQMARDNAATLAGQIREIRDAVDPAALKRLSMPVLLIGGALSPAPFPATLAALQAALPGARTAIIAGASHGMNLAKPKEFNQMVADFFLGKR